MRFHPSRTLLAAPLLLAGACSSRLLIADSGESTSASGTGGSPMSTGSTTSTGSGGADGSGGSIGSGGVPSGAPCTGDDQCAIGHCSTSLTAFDGAPTPSWKLNGSATYDPATQSVVLAPAQKTYTAGTAIYETPIVTDSFTVTFDFRLDTSTGRAEGLAFMIEKDGNHVVGGFGGGLGVSGLDGYGVEHDLWNSANCSGDQNDNHVGIDTLALHCTSFQHYPTAVATSPDLPFDLGDGAWRTEVVSVVDGVASVSIDGTPVDALQDVALPGFLFGSKYFYGFGAATGGAAARQEIRKVKISFPTPRCL